MQEMQQVKLPIPYTTDMHYETVKGRTREELEKIIPGAILDTKELPTWLIRAYVDPMVTASTWLQWEKDWQKGFFQGCDCPRCL